MSDVLRRSRSRAKLAFVAPPMRYQEFTPRPHLSLDVECYWLLEGYEAPATRQPERILPDGCIELIVNLGERFHEHRDDGTSIVQPTRFLAGQLTRPVFVMPTGDVRVFGVRFTPGGSTAFLEGPAFELTDMLVALDAYDCKLEHEIESRLDPAAPADVIVARMDAILTRRQLQRTERGSAVRPAIGRLLRTGGRASLDRIADDLGISGRQLERRFVKDVGVGPKLLSRILRFQQVFQAVERDDARWAMIAAECGYADQSHLIRDFRQFANNTPARLLDDFSTFGAYFTRKHRVSVFSNTGRLS